MLSCQSTLLPPACLKELMVHVRQEKYGPSEHLASHLAKLHCPACLPACCTCHLLNGLLCWGTDRISVE